ncbi:MAG: hemolysin family protein, partial [Candidatus Eremiobacterota bacterium]
GEPAIAHLVEPLFGFLKTWSVTASHVVGLVVTFAIVTTLHIVLGEQVPKMWAIQYCERAAIVTAGPTLWFLQFFSLFIRVLSWMTNVVLKMVGLQASDHHGEGAIYSEEEIQHILALRQQAGEADPLENEMIGRVFSFFDLVSTQIMVPRTEMVCIQDTATLAELRDLAAREMHDRYPVYHENLDDIVGVVMAREVLATLTTGEHGPEAPVTSIMRPVVSVPGSLPVSQLMARMRSVGTRVLIVLDEYGGTAGMVTLGDLLERIVGELDEESASQETEPDIVPQSDGSLVISGLLLTEDVAAQLGSDIRDEHNDTIGGVVFSLLGRKPEVGDEVRLNGHIFRVEALDGLRIDRLSVRKAEPEAVPGQAVRVGTM